jgi:tetratricopeptide (TPR) repeat protein
MSSFLENKDILKLVIKWRRHLTILVVAAGIASYCATFLIQEQYKSFAVMYPSNLFSYSKETPTEQMLQLFQSTQIQNEIIRVNNLTVHYDIDTAKPGGKFYLTKEFEANFSASKTENDAVKIEMLDKDPKMACKIINDMIYIFNVKTLELQKEKSYEVLNIYKRQLDIKQFEIDSIGKALKELKVKYGILDYKAQAKEASKEYYKSLGSNPQKTTDIVNTIRNLEERGNHFLELEENLDGALKAYQKIKKLYDVAVRDVEKKLTYTNMVISPSVSDKKAYPVRWILAVLGALSAAVLCIITIIIIEKKNK